MDAAPRAKQAGCLRNGNPSGNPHAAPRCGAGTRAGKSCRSPAMVNGRCRMHGGTSTGARTPDGRSRCVATAWRHGARSRAVAEERRATRRALYDLEDAIARCEAALAAAATGDVPQTGDNRPTRDDGRGLRC